MDFRFLKIFTAQRGQNKESYQLSLICKSHSTTICLHWRAHVLIEEADAICLLSVQADLLMVMLWLITLEMTLWRWFLGTTMTAKNLNHSESDSHM